MTPPQGYREMAEKLNYDLHEAYLRHGDMPRIIDMCEQALLQVAAQTRREAIEELMPLIKNMSDGEHDEYCGAVHNNDTGEDTYPCPSYDHHLKERLRKARRRR